MPSVTGVDDDVLYIQQHTGRFHSNMKIEPGSTEHVVVVIQQISAAKIQLKAASAPLHFLLLLLLLSAFSRPPEALQSLS